VGVINVESLVKPLEGENPCGENLRWDRAYLEFERLAEGKEERQDGDKVTPAEEPEWRQVRDVAVELLARGRHLRVGIILTLAAVRLEGYPGLRDGLTVIKSWLETTWDQIWPVLDVEDNNDPTERVNSLAALSTPMATYGDKMKFADRVYDCPLCESRQLGRFSLRDIAVATGTLEEKAAPVEGQDARPKPTMSIIDGAFAETDKEKLQEILTAIQEASAALEAIEAIFTEKCGAGIGPNTLPLQTVLKDASATVSRALEGGAATDQAANGSEGGEAGSGEGGGGGGGAALSGDVRNTRDATTALEKVIRHYESSEPSSPVPLILKCAVRMVGQDFLTVSKTIPPDVVSTLVNISTPPEESSS